MTIRIPSNIVSLAKQLAKKSNVASKHAAVLYSKRKILSASCNLHVNKTHSLHAEARVITSRKHLLRQVKHRVNLLVVRISNHDTDVLVESKPCMLCSKLLKVWAKTINIYYSNSQGQISRLWTFDSMHLSRAASRHLLALRDGI